MLRILTALLFGVLVVSVFALVLWTSLDFQECIKSYGQNDPSTKHLEKGISVFVAPIPIYRHCIGAYVTDKNAVITALGTLIIAVFTTVLGIFTVNLAHSTRIAADAAKGAADAAVNVELPILIVSYANLRVAGPVEGSPRLLGANETIPDSFEPIISFMKFRTKPGSDNRCVLGMANRRQP